MNENLGRRAIRGLSWSVGGQLATTAITFLNIAILGRLVSPSDFGTVAIVTSIVGVGEIARDFGLTNATIQATSLSPSERNNLFWINALLGTIIACIFWSLATPIGVVFDNESLVNVTKMLSIGLFLNGLATQPRADLIRSIRLRPVAIIDIIGVTVGLVISVAMAAKGYGYWAIVGMQLGRAVTTTLGAMVATRFVPVLPDRRVSVRHFAYFGIQLFGAQLVTYISRNFDRLLIGHSIGPQSLGYYSRGYDYAFMPTSRLAAPLGSVVIPTLSRLRDDETRYNSYLVRIMKAFMLGTSFLYAGAIVFADIIIRMVLGPGWEGAITPFRILCVAGLADTASWVIYWVFVTKQIPGSLLRFYLMAHAFLILGVLATISLGPHAVAWAVSIWSILLLPTGIWWISRTEAISSRDLIGTGLRIFSVFGTITLVGLQLRVVLSPQSSILDAICTIGVMALTSTLLFILNPKIRQDIRQTIAILQMLRH